MNGSDAFPHALRLADALQGRTRGVYVVIFTSTPREGRDTDELRRLDDAAWLEAETSGGLLRYVRGSYDGACCSICIWRSKADARRASALPAHREAAKRAHEFYDDWQLEKFGG